MNHLKRGLTILGCATLLTGTMGVASAAQLSSANGQGTLDQGARTFSFSAKTSSSGAVSGQAVLTNKNFTGENGHSPYKLQIDITCMATFGNITTFGGTVKRTNDPSLVDAVFFSVQDNGEPGGGVDKISRVAFWDDDPNTTGDPQTCSNPDTLNYTPLETIEKGNIQVR